MRWRVSRTRLFWALVALQVALLGGLVLLEERALSSGTRVVLRTNPVDPVDIVRGNYVALTYDISSVETSDKSVRVGDTVFVALHKVEGDVQTGSTAYANVDGVPGDGLFIQGTVKSHHEGTLSVVYDIETYYAPPDQALSIERELADGARALVALDERGRASLCTVEGSPEWKAGDPASTAGCSGSF